MAFAVLLPKRFMATTHHHPHRLRTTVPPGTRIAAVRSYYKSSIHKYPTKDAQDRESLNPQSTEYSKSGSDDIAATSNTAFDPHKTAPETQKKSAGRESGENPNPLNVSPANQTVNQARDPQEGGPESSSGESTQAQSGRQRTSGQGDAPKRGGGTYGGS